MARELKAKVRLEGDTRGANRAIDETDRGLKRIATSVKNFARSSIVNFAAGAVAITGFVRGIKSVVAAAQEQEAAEAELAAARGKSIDSLVKQAAALQKLTRFGDEQIIRAQALIGSFVKEDEAVKEATKATIDLAAAKKLDLVAAADLVSKTLGSSTNALSRYGIEVTGAVGSTERLTTLTENIAKVFGGRAAAEVNTFQGRVGQLSNVFGDVLENIGFAIIKNKDFLESIKALTSALAEHGAEIANYIGLLVKLGTEVIGGVVDKLNQLGTAIGKVVVYFKNLGADEAETSLAALERTADNLGISVEELTKRIEENRKARRKASAAARELAQAEQDGIETSDAAAAAIKKISVSLKDTADAYASAVESASVFGQVTSVQLEDQIIQINVALEQQRNILGAHSAEYERLEQVASAKVDSLRERIENLKRGLGDLATETRGGVDALDDWGEGLDAAGRRTDLLIEKNERLAASFLRTSAAGSGGGSTLRGASGSILPDPFSNLKGGTFSFIEETKPYTVLSNGRVVYL